MSPAQHQAAGRQQYGAYARFWSPNRLAEAMEAVRPMVPATARDVVEIVIDSHCGCCDGPCPNEPGFFAMKWYA